MFGIVVCRFFSIFFGLSQVVFFLSIGEAMVMISAKELIMRRARRCSISIVAPPRRAWTRRSTK